MSGIGLPFLYRIERRNRNMKEKPIYNVLIKKANSDLKVALREFSNEDPELEIHIVRLDRIKMFNQINLLNGYGILTIISPKEVYCE
jgi:hypothetical protein